MPDDAFNTLCMTAWYVACISNPGRRHVSIAYMNDTSDIVISTAVGIQDSKSREEVSAYADKACNAAAAGSAENRI